MKTFIFVFLMLATSTLMAGDRFVIITDSHGVGKYGESLKSQIRNRPETSYHFFASGGSAPLQWLNRAFTTTCGFEETSTDEVSPSICKKLLTPKLSDLWDKYPVSPSERRVTIIVQGTNLPVAQAQFEEQVRYTKKLLNVALERSDVCIWVGPPNMRRAPGFDAQGVETKIKILMTALEDKCHFIDSRQISTYPSTGDGIHYHMPGSQNQGQIDASLAWAEATFLRIEESLIR